MEIFKNKKQLLEHFNNPNLYLDYESEMGYWKMIYDDPNKNILAIHDVFVKNITEISIEVWEYEYNYLMGIVDDKNSSI